MKNLSTRFLLLAAAALLSACGMLPYGNPWVSVIDGNNGLDNFNRIGDANWRAQDGAIVADAGKGGFLVTKKVYRDFEIRAEFWAEPTTNSGIFIRAMNPQRIEATTSYEVNIFDQRPDPSYGTAGIVNFAKVDPMPRAGGKWNTFEITARGPRLVVVFNGVKTVDIQNFDFAHGPFALQYALGANNIPGGAIKWRKLQIREL